MIVVKNLTYKLPDNTELFGDLSFALQDSEKIAVVGKNGIGKSVLLKLIVGELTSYSGDIKLNDVNYGYFPQKFNELAFNTVADVFGLENEIFSLDKVENNSANVDDYLILDNHWNCVIVIDEKMKFFDLKFDYLKNFQELSGGEKVKLILSSIINKNTNFLILDEPTNNMDYESKTYFYDFIKNWQGGILLVSHDRELLNLVDKIIELRKIGMKNTKIFTYGGNYECFLEQKNIEEEALGRNYDNSIKKLEKQRTQIVKNQENMNERTRQGNKNLKLGCFTKEMADWSKNNAEKGNGKIMKKSNSELANIESNLGDIKDKMEIKQNIYFKFENQEKIPDKIVLEIKNLTFSYENKQLFRDFNLIAKSKERISITGKNGSGKSVLLKIIMNKINNYMGEVRINLDKTAYLDQEQAFLSCNKTILDCVVDYAKLNELECRNLLAKFLFRTDAVQKQIKNLSGGEKLRVALACIFGRSGVELLLLDEPTNNLDLDSIEILENILNQFNGGIIVISHDKIFKKNIKIIREITCGL